tara:strand:- start:6928 stop:7782 length:855 start_codon:yes stop_codon:yes gene_type:complete
MKILVTGSNGQLGKEIYTISNEFSQFTWIFLKKNDLNFLQTDKIQTSLDFFTPNIIINCAAITDVDYCENNNEIANKVNNLAVKELAKWSRNNKCKLFHISSNFVYKSSPEELCEAKSAVCPINFYGTTKLNSEINCLKYNPNSIIIRTSWLYSIHGKNFFKRIMRKFKSREPIDAIYNHKSSPTYAYDLADSIMKIIFEREWKPGIYNFCNQGSLSMYDIVLFLKKHIYSSNEINKIKIENHSFKATRPEFSVMNTNKIQLHYNINIQNYKQGFEKCLQLLND